MMQIVTYRNDKTVDQIIQLILVKVGLMLSGAWFILPFMTNIEKFDIAAGLIVMGIGAGIFGWEVIDPIPDIFGYHEVRSYDANV